MWARVSASDVLPAHLENRFIFSLAAIPCGWKGKDIHQAGQLFPPTCCRQWTVSSTRSQMTDVRAVVQSFSFQTRWVLPLLIQIEEWPALLWVWKWTWCCAGLLSLVRGGPIQKWCHPRVGINLESGWSTKKVESAQWVILAQIIGVNPETGCQSKGKSFNWENGDKSKHFYLVVKVLF
jgi:hypothetical protein